MDAVIKDFDDFDNSLDVDTRRAETLRKIEILESLGPDVHKDYSERALPLELYSFTLKSIICPQLQIDLTPQFLDVLAMIEFYRSFIVEKMTQDICHRWLQQSNTDFWVRWNQYFSFLEDSADHPHNQPILKFQHGMKAEEREHFRKAAHMSFKYINDTLASAEDQRLEGQTVREVLEAPHFAEEYRPKNLSDFSDRIISYADKVSDAWNKLRTANIYNVRLDLSENSTSPGS
ncbi:hypothetical protein CVT24_006197 [Panaeolus cyanescens]|uniref:Uncharacterized protein n=1 Tax=Panaeolus cyanescens TaxID=181874 RepID=A0A409VE55_9AGAR|nr:hypothetical protein CVT24_006197 [Panaeolus cyanescens]